MKMLPPPMDALNGGASISGNMDTEKEVIAGDVGTADRGVTSSWPWDKYGAYVVRVQLRNVDAAGRSIPARTAEEAFYQVLSPDSAP
jgi:hypothetical protein